MSRAVRDMKPAPPQVRCCRMMRRRAARIDAAEPDWYNWQDFTKGGSAVQYWILADIGNDLPKSYADKHERFQLVPMPYRIDGVEHEYRPADDAVLKEFYRKLRAGSESSTSAINMATYYSAFHSVAKLGEPLIYLCLSTGISGSFQSAVLARDAVIEQLPDARIYLVDSLGASLGFGLLTHYALENRAKGMSAEDNYQWLLDNRQRVNHWFTVDDLNFLFRGGRVTKSSALLGSMLRIKPVLRVDEQGKLVPFEKVQGRKRSLKALADKAIELSNPREGQTYFISHGDCLEDAEYVRDRIREGLPNAGEFMIAQIGAVIGSHSGPGTLALFFLADHR